MARIGHKSMKTLVEMLPGPFYMCIKKMYHGTIIGHNHHFDNIKTDKWLLLEDKVLHIQIDELESSENKSYALFDGYK